MESDSITDEQLGSWLVEDKLISQNDLDWALESKKEENSSLSKVIINSGLIPRLIYYKFLARKLHLRFFDYHKSDYDHLLLKSFDLDFLRDNQFIPVNRQGDDLTVAMINPLDKRLIKKLSEMTGLNIKPIVTTELDISWAISAEFEPELIDKVSETLAREHPEESAKMAFSKGHIVFFLSVFIAVLIFSLFPPYWGAFYLNVFFQCIFIFTILFKFYATLVGLFFQKDEVPSEAEEIEEKALPIYTILVPVYKESKVLPEIIKSISEFDYPKSKLDVKILFEEDDRETLSVAKSLNPQALFEFLTVPQFHHDSKEDTKKLFSDHHDRSIRRQERNDANAFFNLVIVPTFKPRTKPKACNWGLQFARGEYVTIYDAEDRPEPDQLKKVLYRFRNNPEKVVCVQASLNYYNPYDNFLTKMFTLEYSYWFDFMLPGLEKMKMPIPLGGTSNHFNCKKLIELGGWDPFNVTEDADLGIRASRRGYEIRTARSTTWEEANNELKNWFHQRTRWLKGYMMTFIVHMQTPILTFKELGLRRFIGFLLFIGGTPFSFLINPILWIMFFAWLIFRLKFFDPLFPDWLLYMGIFNLAIGNGLMVFCHMIAVLRRKYYRLAPWALLSPVYWLLCSFAAWRALFQIFTEPFKWEKTKHGLSQKSR